jgi:hypothetical protein
MARTISMIALVDLVALLAAGPMALAQSPSAIPDLSGAWARATFATEPPDSGPGPLRNPSPQRPGPPAYASPLLTPQAAAVVKERYETTLAGKPYPTPSSACWPMVAPFVYRVQEIQVVQTKDEVLLISMQDHDVRRVRLNAQHPAKVTPTWHGDSVGHYESETLVIDTVGTKVGKINVGDAAGSPYSEALHVVERYRLISFDDVRAARERLVQVNGPPGTRQAAGIDENYGGKGLQVEFTVEDPNVYTQKWSGKATYGKADDLWVENVCAENTFEYYNNKDTPLPVGEKPDF